MDNHQKRQLLKLKNLYMHHCISETSRMEETASLVLFRDGNKARCVAVDQDILAEFDKLKYFYYRAFTI